jgi:phage/plasmid-associated DNA primase
MNLGRYLCDLKEKLISDYHGCILVHTQKSSVINGKSLGKTPALAHKNKTDEYLWDKWDKIGVHLCDQGTAIILRDTLIVLDGDDIEFCDKLESDFPIIKNTAIQKTRTGRHYFFMRTADCDIFKIFDKARCLFDDNGNVMPLDIKTKCSTGTGGIISIFPSPNKHWINSIITTPAIPFPDPLLKFVVSHLKKPKVKSSSKSKTIDKQTDDVNINQVIQFVNILNKKRSNNYTEWIELGWCLHNISPDLLSTWIDFSKNGDSYTPGECEILWDKMREEGFGIGSLHLWAKCDNPIEYNKITQVNASKPTSSQKKARLQSTLPKSNFNVQDTGFINLSPDDVKRATDAIISSLNITSQDITVNTAYISPDASGANDKGVLHLDLVINTEHDLVHTNITLHLDTLKLTRDGSDVSYLHTSDDQGIPIVNFDLAGIDRSLKSGMKWITTRPSDKNIKFTSDAPRAQIDILNFHNPSARFAELNLLDSKKSSTITVSKKVNMLIDAYSNSIHNALSDTLGLGHIFINNLQVVINNPPTNDERHDDESLITFLLQTQNDFKKRWRFSPDVKSANCNGLFYCDVQTNIWRQVHNAYVEDMLVSAFENVETLTDDDRKFIKSRRGGAEMRLMLVRKVLHESFHNLLDENTDIFAVRNGVFDNKDNLNFRPITPEDMVFTHADWIYDPELAKAKRPDVELFLSQVFPVDAERKVFLNYMASLLSGRRKIKKFLVLTDYRGGHNGKSTVSRLFRRFLSNFAKSCTKFVCKGAFDRDRDSHDAGLEPFKGKRLLLAEELKKTMTLDVAMLKQFTGGPGEVVEGRKCGSGDWFKYIWQAGFILIFNENDSPKFDTADEAFIGRMTVIPMRSKFVPADANGFYSEMDEEYTYVMDKDLDYHFDDWLPALADILVEHYDENGLDMISDSMKEWRTGITNTSNSLSEWFEDHIIITGEKSDKLILKDLYGFYNESNRLDDLNYRSVSKAEFEELTRKFCAARRDVGVVFKTQHDIKQADGTFRNTRNVIIGGALAKQMAVHGFLKKNKRVDGTLLSELNDTSSAAEERFRKALEAKLGYAMSKTYPVWLQNPRSGCQLELDFYDDINKVAIEYDGPHHYTFPNMYHATQRQFIKQKERDHLKDTLCKLNGVKLIRVKAGSCTAHEVEYALQELGRLLDVT